MFLSLDFFGFDEGAIFQTRMAHSGYNELHMTGTMIDELYVDESIEMPLSSEKPDNWSYSTVVDAKLQGNLEAGSVQSGGMTIESIKVQRRRWDDLVWEDVTEFDYNVNNRDYELFDWYVQNAQVYQYSLLPVTNTVLGNRLLSNEVEVDFEGVFLSDKGNNYKLLYDLEFGNITHNSPSNKFETLGSSYPIVVYSNLDYTEFDVKATFISTQTINNECSGQTNVRMEKLGRDTLLRWVKNKKPKVYRDINGNLKLVSIIGSPEEVPNNSVCGIASLSLSMTEIGKMDNETLLNYGLRQGLGGVF